ncbi:putative signal peptide protein, partial [Puccinia sorghi]
MCMKLLLSLMRVSSCCGCVNCWLFEKSARSVSCALRIVRENLKFKHEITSCYKELAIASWAIVVLVALCHEPNTGNPQTSSHLLAHSFSADLHAQFKTQFFPKSLLILAMVNCMFYFLQLSE